MSEPAASAPSSIGARLARVLVRLLDLTPFRLTFFLALVMIPLGQVFRLPNHGGFTLDWQFFQFFDEVARRTIADYHQFPFWNPYFCGGTTMIGNPQTTFLVPTFPLVLWFGTTFGERLSNIPVLVLGCEGGWRLMRWLGVRRSAALLVAVALPFYARTWEWFHDGQHGLSGWALSLWVIYGYLRGLQRPVYLVLGGAFLAWMVSYRGIETTPELALGLFVWAIFEVRRRLLDPTERARGWRHLLWPIGAGAVLGLFALGFAGVRMVPVFDLVLNHHRIVNENTRLHLSRALVEHFAIRPRTVGYEAPGYAYIGLLTWLLFFGSMLVARGRKRAGIPSVVALFFVLLSMGYQGVFTPLHWLHKAPLFKVFRNPTLWSFGAALFMVIAAGLALDELVAYFEERRWQRAARYLAPLVALLVTVDLLYFAQWITSPPHAPFAYGPAPFVEQEFRQARGNRMEQVLWVYLNRGSLSCYDETPFTTGNGLRADLPDEEYLADPAAGSVRRVRWTPNALELEATLTSPGTVLVNQNWDTGWSTSAGTLRAHDGILAVDLPAGTTRFRLTYWPRGSTIGLLLMLLAAVGAWWMIRRDRRQLSAGSASG